MRVLRTLLVVGLLASACGGGGESGTPTTSTLPPSTTPVPTTTTTLPATSTTTTTTTTLPPTTTTLPPTTTTTLPPTTTTTTTRPPREWTLLAGGDVLMERPAQGGFDPFELLEPSLASADIAFVNLETAITERGSPATKMFVFRAPLAAAQTIADAGIDIVAMANNHARDYGEVGLTDSLDALAAAGVAVVGAGIDDTEAYSHRIIQVPDGPTVAFVAATHIQPYGFGAEEARPGVALALTEEERFLDSVRTAAEVAAVVVVSVHWGDEYETCQVATQEELAEKLFAAGATIILGHHPHVLQPIIERGDGRLVAYSLGNFVFPPRHDVAGETVVLEVRFVDDQMVGWDFHPHVYVDPGLPSPLTGGTRHDRVIDVVGGDCARHDPPGRPPPTTLPPRAPTIDELLALDRPLNLAHAGGDQDYPHSTMYAFRQAAAAGVDLLEMDVRISADGVLVVHHDDDVFGTTGAEGVVAELTLAELQALDNAWWWSPTCWPCRDLADDDYPFRGMRTGDVEPPEGFSADDFRIETFRSVAEAFPTLALDVEIKNRGENSAAAIAALVADLDALDRRDSVVVVSFSSDVVAAFKEAAPDVATSPGTDEMIAWILGGEALGDHPVVQVPPEYEGVPVLVEAFFTAVEEAGVEVWVWPDSADQEEAGFYTALLDLAIDGIIVGRPATFESVLQQGGYAD